MNREWWCVDYGPQYVPEMFESRAAARKEAKENHFMRPKPVVRRVRLVVITYGLRNTE